MSLTKLNAKTEETQQAMSRISHMRSLYLANKGELELEKQRVSELLLEISRMKDNTEELQIAKAEIERMKVVHKEELKRENRRYGELVAQERRRYDKHIAQATD